MRKIITEINDKLKSILADLEIKKEECFAALNLTKNKIEEKFEEAKSYKLDVDALKDKINTLEEEISALEVDLNDLNERFGKKELNAIIEAGNKEINSKIIAKQKEITKHREKISELTEKARSIKDLLINLKKDKESKNEKYNNYTKAYDFYSKRLNEIIDFSSENPDNLLLEKEPEREIVNNYSNEEINSPVFDEIRKLDENENTNELVEEDNNQEEIKYQKMDFEALNNQIDEEYANIFGDSEDISIEKMTEDQETSVVEENNIELEEENNAEIIEGQQEKIADNFSEFENSPLDIDSLIGSNSNYQNEYVESNSNTEPSVAVEPIVEPVIEPINPEPLMPPIENTEINNGEDHSGFTEFDIFKNSYKNEPLESSAGELTELFKNNNIDYNNFKDSDKKMLESNFNKEMYSKMFDVLKRNNISLDYIYSSANLFYEGTPSEVEHVISKLLLAGQTTSNISYVLSSLPLINSYDLSEVIKSYGPNVNSVNITDLIIKAKHLNQMGGNR